MDQKEIEEITKNALARVKEDMQYQIEKNLKETLGYSIQREIQEQVNGLVKTEVKVIIEAFKPTIIKEITDVILGVGPQMAAAMKDIIEKKVKDSWNLKKIFEGLGLN